MSYLSPQAGEIVSNNDRQPTDMPRDGWASMSNTYGSEQFEQSSTDRPWVFRRPPRLHRGTGS